MIYPDSELVSNSLKRYYELNGLPPDGGVKDPWARYKFGSFQAIAFPNFKHRIEAIRRHDLHHIVNDLDTSSLGEGRIAAWELGSGCGGFWISWFMESQALWWGILLDPRRMFSFYQKGRNSRNYFHEPFNEDHLFQKTVGELRSNLFPSEPVKSASIQDVLYFVFIAIFGLFSMLVFFPIVTLFTAIGFFSHTKKGSTNA
jgi:hypothetical protein